jgi:hypothetical protein
MCLKADILDELDSLMDSDTVDTDDLQPVRDLAEMLPDDIRVQLEDAREGYDPGDRGIIVIEDPGNDTRHGDPMGRLPDGLVVFLSNAPDAIQPLERGQQVDVTLTTVRSWFAHAVPT